MSEPARSLVRKLAEVMGDVERIPKSGYNDFHRYSYATEADIVAAVRKGLAARNVMIVHKVDDLKWRLPVKASGESGSPIATVSVTFTAIDGDSGETLPVAQTIGEGQDSGDKAVYKALTGALKYAVLKLFLIPTGDDPEAAKKRKAAGEAGEPARRDPPRESGSRPPAATGPATFPNFGKWKGESISGASAEALEFHLGSARRSLADPEKARYHAKESALIGAIEAELARQRKAPPEGQRETAAAPAPPAKPDLVVDVRPGETMERAKQRSIYETAVELIGRAKSVAQVDKILKSIEGGKVTPEHAVDLGRRGWAKKDALLRPPPVPAGDDAMDRDHDSEMEATHGGGAGALTRREPEDDAPFWLGGR